MKNRLLPLALAGLGVAGSVVLGQAPVAADPGKPKKKDLVESECRDVIGGTASYARDRTVDVPDLPDEDYPDSFQADSGTATLNLILAAPSCEGVVYTLTVYAEDGTVLGTTSIVGNGRDGTNQQPLVLTQRVAEYPHDCLKALIGTTSVQGVVVDTAPDEMPVNQPVCDGDDPALSYK